MNFKQNLISLSIGAAFVALSGCSVTSQDQGFGASESKALSGVAVDGYIARAVVYIDTNENNKLDVWEKRALTDGQGYFTYNPVSEENYCLDTTPEFKQIHCLRAPAGYDEVLVRLTQGYDLTTVEPFTGTLSMRVNVEDGVITTPLVATPLTGLLSAMTAAEKADFLLAESLTEELLSEDFLDVNNTLSDADRLKLLEVAIKTHKVADVIAGLLSKEFIQTTEDEFFGEVEGMPTDGAVYVYEAMVDELSDTLSVSNVLSNTTAVNRIIKKVWNDINQVITDYNESQDSTTDQYSTVAVNDARVTVIEGMVIDLETAIDNIFTSALDSADLSGDIASRLRASSIIASLMRDNEIGAAGSAKNAAEDNVTVGATSGLTYMESLRFEGTDVTSIKAAFIAGTFVVDDADFSGRKTFAQLLGGTETGTGLSGDNSEGFAGNELNMGTDGDSVGIVFAEDPNDPAATSGTMTIDAGFTDGEFATDSGEELVLEGTWEQLDEYTMLMNVEVAGVVQPVIIKPTVADDGTTTAYYFDMDGEQIKWDPGT